MALMDLAGFFSVVDPYSGGLKLPFTPPDYGAELRINVENTPSEIVKYVLLDPASATATVAGQIPVQLLQPTVSAASSETTGFVKNLGDALIPIGLLAGAVWLISRQQERQPVRRRR